VGANRDRRNNAGSVFIFEHTDGEWSQQAKFTPDASASANVGISVAIDGDTVAAGADSDGRNESGSAFVFERSEGEWSQQATLTAEGQPNDAAFGASVAVAGDTLAVGANDDRSSDSGAAYVFERTDGEWSQQAQLVAADAQEGDNFGASVALSDGTALVGADEEGQNNTGSAYVFERTDGEWSQQAKLTPDARSGANVGVSVSLEGETALLGAWQDNRNESGAAYVFERTDGEWSQEAKLVADDGLSNDNFGISVSLSGRTVAGGAWKGTRNDWGSVHIFDL
jgi:hypothetical protein